MVRTEVRRFQKSICTRTQGIETYKLYSKRLKDTYKPYSQHLFQNEFTLFDNYVAPNLVKKKPFIRSC